jgi:hypothetical protein
MGEVGCYCGATKTQEETTMLPDLIEDLAAFVYATQRLSRDNVCTVCGRELEENEDGEVICPECSD